MLDKKLDRRDFNKLSVAALGGMVAGATGTSFAQGTASGAAAEKKKKEVHVCRGLNSCKGNGADGKNTCAGQGVCATAKAHTCAASNACKGQGGCGAMPGENACKGKGKCAVPLMDKAWKTARTRFETRMKKAKKKFGDAPPKPKKKG